MIISQFNDKDLSQNEVMLCFNNNKRSVMHMILENFKEFFDLLRLMFANHNPDKTLKVFGVNEKSLAQYYTSSD